MYVKTIHELFDFAVAKNPQAIAIEQNNSCISYEDLKCNTDYIARCLIHQGIIEQTVVGVFLPSSIAYVSSIIAISRAGGIFMPMEIDHPAKRQQFIIETTHPRLWITTKEHVVELQSLLSEFSDKNRSGAILILNNQDASLEIEVADANGVLTSYDDNAWQIGDGNINESGSCYVIFTSGSTGSPKAIEGTQRGLVHFIRWEIQEFSFDENVKVSQLAPITFDVSLRDIFVPLCAGGTLCIPPVTTRLHPFKLMQWIWDSKVTLIHCVPSVFRLLTDELRTHQDLVKIADHLKWIILAGEALYGKDVMNWYSLMGSKIRLANFYGPSETTLAKLFYRINFESIDKNSIIPLGKPISDTVVIVSKNGRLCEVGETGELFIKTSFRSKGYYKDPSLTNDKFVQNPIHNDFQDIVYRTGDLGKYLSDFSITFVGRQDTQLKINGNRVELSEIETNLLTHSEIKQTVVLPVRKNDSYEITLACYYLAATALDDDAIRTHLKAFIPDYMIPSVYIRMDSFPLNSNGKIDRKALPDPEVVMDDSIEQLTPVEEKLLAIWTGVLNIERISRKSSFFQLGGSSLKAIQVISRIYKEFNVLIKLPDIFAAQTIAEQAMLITRLGKTIYEEIIPIKSAPFYSVSPAQKRMWIIDQLIELKSVYTVSHAYRVRGTLHHNALGEAFNGVVKRHEILRTSFESLEGTVVQRVHEFDSTKYEIKFVDLREQQSVKQEVDRLLQQGADQYFALDNLALIRLHLLQTSDDEWIVALYVHHIISDAWSLQILFNEILQVYHATLQGQPALLEPLEIQFRDFASWQNSIHQNGKLQKAKQFWLANLTAPIPVLHLPADFPRPDVRSHEGLTMSHSFSKNMVSKMTELSQRHDVSLFTLLTAILKILFYKYTGQKDIIIGTPVSGRDDVKLEKQIGLFLNTIALRSIFSGRETFSEFIKAEKSVILSALENRAYPFDTLIDELNLNRDATRSPLFDVMLTVQDATMAEVNSILVDITIEKYPFDNRTSKFDLLFNFETSAQGIILHLEYNSNLYQRDRIGKMIGHFEEVLLSAHQDPSRTIQKISYLSSSELKRLLHDVQGKQSEVINKPIHQFFEEQVLKTPDHLAIIFEGTTLTYQQLNETANQVAHCLHTNYRVSDGDYVGLLMDRSEWMVIAMLGIMKAGGVYVPIDPHYPQARQEYIINDTNQQLLISDRSYVMDAITHRGLRLLELEQLRSELSGMSKENIGNAISADHSAYIIYTSGSTGQPKGVEISYKNTSAFIQWALEEFSRSDFSIVYASTSYCFDLSIFEVFYTLSAGKSIRILRSSLDIGLYLFQDRKVLINTVPSVMEQLVKSQTDLSSVTVLNLAGEPIGSVVKNALDYGRIEVRNLYGPSEDCTYSSCFKFTGNPGSIPIGKPILNTKFHILNEDRGLLPEGWTGEIYISGDGLAKGYINNPALTNERFVESPFEEGVRLYRTGDLGRWSSDGNMYFLGRVDKQIKLNGVRIELGEIENTLITFSGIKKAVVLHRDGKLIAFYSSESTLREQAINDHIKKILPAYMIPSRYQWVSDFPLNSNGKIDVGKLEYVETNSERKILHAELASPIQKQLLKVWQAVLETERIGWDDNFFEIGGNSLKVIHMTGLLRKEYPNHNIKAPYIYSYPTIGKFAAFIEQEPQTASEEKKRSGKVKKISF
jgi:amino acid adenylation domain-containing protein